MSVQQNTISDTEPRQLLADPAATSRSPGEEFAATADLRSGGDVTVPYRVYLPTAFPLFANRPRYTVRQLLRMANIRDEPWPYFAEAPAGDGRATSGTSYDATLEWGFTPRIEHAKPLDVEIAVPLPPGALGHPSLLAAFIDYRVLVRIGVRENQLLLHGDGGDLPGLLSLPELRRAETGRRPVAAVTEAAALVEETGGSCDGIVAHPNVYWQFVESGMLERLAEAGVRVARTRMMPQDRLLLGDFRAAASVLDPHVSSLTLRRGDGPEDGGVIEARSRFALAVHLPQHFVELTFGGDA
ncbi:family 3 encapsulin nanocompartment shell protein [Actinomadura flavalba]|uniref:family 3 encapsulin nanocompartment shell protein n=1 Tax=Actinomadura flavalba TaxID=1120938 RepID=UPI0003669907|nr:family 3 encapsulin nanocompartment shell protein [Actinomadura flavalba]